MMNNDIGQNMLKSNTSIVGIVCKDGVVIGADRRTTAGSIVMNKSKQKIRKINDYLVASYTGGVADLELTNKVIAAELRLKELKTKSRPTVEEAANLLGMIIYRNIRTPTMIPSIVGTLIGGIDDNGKASLYTIEPAGAAMEVEDYDANFSSGMPYILGFLEREYKKFFIMADILKSIKDELPKVVSDANFEGANIVLYTSDKEFFRTGESKVKEVVDKIKKRIELRAENKILASEDETEKTIRAIVPEEAGIENIIFDVQRSTVVIEAKKPGMVIGKQG